MRAAGPGLRAAVILVALVLVAPTLVVIPMSFTAGTTFSFPPDDWSLRWYREFVTEPAWRTAIGNSLRIALAVAALSVVLGTAAAIGLVRATFRGTSVLRALLLSPMTVPNIVTAIAVYVLFLRWQLNGTYLGFVLANTAVALPFVVISVSSSLQGFDRRLETAASSLGASPWTVFRSVTLPLVLPGVLSGAVFAFVTSFDEVVIALFLQSPTLTTLPVQMYKSVTLEIDPTIAAASSVVVVVVSLLILLPQLRAARRLVKENSA